eukprot:318946-Rhodomonas_salina.2
MKQGSRRGKGEGKAGGRDLAGGHVLLHVDNAADERGDVLVRSLHLAPQPCLLPVPHVRGRAIPDFFCAVLAKRQRRAVFVEGGGGVRALLCCVARVGDRLDRVLNSPRLRKWRACAQARCNQKAKEERAGA